MAEIEKRLSISVARDEVMSMVYIMLNFVEEERTQEQCTEIIRTVIGATYTSPLTAAQLAELASISRDVLGCLGQVGITMTSEQIMEVFGPERTVVEMRQTALKGGSLSDTLRIWREVGTLDYLGRVISVKFNDCNGIKAWQLNRICSIMEVMNKKLIKTGSTSEIITLEELCGAFKYKTRHPGTKWALAIKSTLHQRINTLPVNVEKLFSHFLSHEKRRLSALEGPTKRRREVFYSVPEFVRPTFPDSVTPASPAQGIPPVDSRRPEIFYTFNSMPRWVQNRFVFASAFMEETLLRFGNLVHVSPVRLYNELGGRLDESSDLSPVFAGSSLTSEQHRVLLAAFCDYEKRMLSEHNLSSDSLTNDEFLEAFYEFPLAKYVEGRYFIEAGVNIAEILTTYMSSSGGGEAEVFPQLVTREGLSRIYCFQAFVNSRVKTHLGEGNISFITTEEASRILSGCVDNSKHSYIYEMRTSLSPAFFTDSIIETLAMEWVEYEGTVLPRVLDLDLSPEAPDRNVLGSIYSSGVVFSVLAADGWVLLVDPAVPLLGQNSRVDFYLSYSVNSLSGAGPRENRIRFITQWLQQYFLYMLGRIPAFNLEQVRALVEALPSAKSLSREEIRAKISEARGLSLSEDQAREFSLALEAYFFYEKYFIYAKSFDLENSFAADRAQVRRDRPGLPHQDVRHPAPKPGAVYQGSQYEAQTQPSGLPGALGRPQPDRLPPQKTPRPSDGDLPRVPLLGGPEPRPGAGPGADSAGGQSQGDPFGDRPVESGAQRPLWRAEHPVGQRRLRHAARREDQERHPVPHFRARDGLLGVGWVRTPDPQQEKDRPVHWDPGRAAAGGLGPPDRRKWRHSLRREARGAGPGRALHSGPGHWELQRGNRTSGGAPPGLRLGPGPLLLDPEREQNAGLQALGKLGAAQDGLLLVGLPAGQGSPGRERAAAGIRSDRLHRGRAPDRAESGGPHCLPPVPHGSGVHEDDREVVSGGRAGHFLSLESSRRRPGGGLSGPKDDCELLQQQGHLAVSGRPLSLLLHPELRGPGRGRSRPLGPGLLGLERQSPPFGLLGEDHG
ncbi:hypothetical protein OJ253_2523 [Cryptosporidium canis]|uniref:Uncharacterized protein n=1 Tax=Cryptosporidium canis TaxID=195482 RepID=A0A9D5DGB7_9CRYT|nr:hypothetical protein OJ253_2523 [Cryptosporidium canis]